MRDYAVRILQVRTVDHFFGDVSIDPQCGHYTNRERLFVANHRRLPCQSSCCRFLGGLKHQRLKTALFFNRYMFDRFK